MTQITTGCCLLHLRLHQVAMGPNELLFLLDPGIHGQEVACEMWNYNPKKLRE
jgi:hypothetical protein